MPDSPLLRIQDLSRRDRTSGRAILDRINMTIDQGERIGLVGASGSGKSSLLRAIARLDLCDEGSIVFRSEVVARDSIPKFRRQVIYLPQRPSLFATTVRENLQIPFRLAVSRARSDGVQSEQQDYDESIVTGILRGLGKPITILDQSAESLSGGEQQIVALIRALILRPSSCCSMSLPLHLIQRRPSNWKSWSWIGTNHRQVTRHPHPQLSMPASGMPASGMPASGMPAS